MTPGLDEMLRDLDTPRVVCLRDAKHSDGRKGDAFLGHDLTFSTLDKSKAEVFPRWNADRYADHWRGLWRGFAGRVAIEVMPA